MKQKYNCDIQGVSWTVIMLWYTNVSTNMLCTSSVACQVYLKRKTNNVRLSYQNKKYICTRKNQKKKNVRVETSDN